MRDLGRTLFEKDNELVNMMELPLNVYCCDSVPRVAI